MDKIVFIAKLCHCGWWCYMRGLGKGANPFPSHEQFESIKDGVKFNLSHRDSTPEENHNNWMKKKIEDGWTFGPEKDEIKKTHPDLIPYRDLPQEEQTKDSIFKFMFDMGLEIWELLFTED